MKLYIQNMVSLRCKMLVKQELTTLGLKYFVHWGVFKHLRKEVKANGIILITALFLDLIVLVAFLWIKASSDLFVVLVSVIGILLVFAGEKWFLHWKKIEAEN